MDNGLTSVTLDELNRGAGFNLNLLCLKMEDSTTGEQACYHLPSITDPHTHILQTPFAESPPGWAQLNEADFSMMMLNTHGPCKANGEEVDDFCVDRFVLDLNGKTILGLTDKFSVTG